MSQKFTCKILAEKLQELIKNYQYVQQTLSQIEQIPLITEKHKAISSIFERCEEIKIAINEYEILLGAKYKYQIFLRKELYKITGGEFIYQPEQGIARVKYVSHLIDREKDIALPRVDFFCEFARRKNF
jgi:hypothetical protein